jgi:acyl-CoA oxidase
MSSFARSLSKLVNRHHPALRKEYLALFKNQVFKPRYDLTLKEERQVAYDRLNLTCQNGLMYVHWFKKEPTKIFTAHEMMGFADGSTATKMTVQFNLFGGTVLKIGTEKHHHLLDEIDSFDSVGCFALTERGYGNNAVKMESTAVLDEDTNEFVINTPTEMSDKYWITNSADHAQWAVVFAQMMVKGQNEGVHGFLVPMRDKETHEIKPGVKIEDMGHKIGFNGVDNGILGFKNVRVPKDNLLDAITQVKEDNTVVSQYKSPRARFIGLADQLISGRICIASMCLSSTKVVLKTTVDYSKQRLCVGKSGESDTPIMDYQLQQQAIAPMIARTYALNFGLQDVQELYEEDADPEGILKGACIIKPLVTWNTEEVSSICREKVGGFGYLASSRYGEGIAGGHAGITAEGDNRVLTQKVAKEVLDGVSKNDVKKHVIFKKLPHWLFSLDFNSLLQVRADHTKHELAYRLHSGGELFDTWMHKESTLVQRVGIAYGENMVLKSFDAALEGVEKDTKMMLKALRNLYVLDCIQRDKAWFLENNIMSYSNARKCTQLWEEQCSLVAENIEEYVNGFDVPEMPQ